MTPRRAKSFSPYLGLRRLAWAGVIAVGLVLVRGRLPAQIAYGANLLINGDAESGAAGLGEVVLSIPGWSTTSDFTAVQYDAPGGFPLTSDPGPAARGLNFFAGGTNTGLSTATQVVDLSGYFNFIDGGSIPFELAGFFGGFSGQSDYLELTATFRDGSAAAIGSVTIGGVSVIDRSGATGLLFRSTTGILPIGTRDALFTMTATRTDGAYDDGYADNLSFSIAIPEPATAAAWAAAFVILFVAIHRRRSGLSRR